MYFSGKSGGYYSSFGSRLKKTALNLGQI